MGVSVLFRGGAMGYPVKIPIELNTESLIRENGSMKNAFLASALASAMMLTSGSAALAAGDLGEFGNNCAYGLSQGAKKYTDCSVNEKIDDKLYCFSTQTAKEAFMKDPEGNLAKAESFYNDNQ